MLKSIYTLYFNSFQGLNKKVWFLSLVMLINRSGMMVLPFLALYLTQELDWSKFHAGVATSCFGLGSIAGSFIGGWLTDRIGTFRVMANSLILGGICFFFFLFTLDFVLLCGIIFLVSTVSDAFRPALFTAVEEHSNETNLTRGISLVRMAVNLGISIGPAAGGFLAAYYGYDWLFVIDGITCILAGIVLLTFHKSLSTPLRIKTEFEEVAEKSKPTSPYKDSLFVGFLVVNLINLIVFFQVLYSVPVYFSEIFQLEESQIGWFFTANGLIIFFFEMPIIYLLERKRKAFGPLMTGSFLIGVSFLALFYFDLPLVCILIYTLLVSVGEIINFPFISTVALKRAGKDSKGKYMGSTTVMFSMAFMIAPLVGLPVIALTGYKLYWLFAFLTVLCAVIGYQLLRSKLELTRTKGA